MSRPYEEDGDELFRADAQAQGYFVDDSHEPGNGRGLRAYYRDNGMVQPEELRREVTRKELTGFSLDEGRGITSVDLDGNPWRPKGRHTSQGARWAGERTSEDGS